MDARYNVAPMQDVPVVWNQPEPCLGLARWGLVPFWAKDPSIGSRMINARAETIAEKPAFRAALRQRRCLLPADGFYEWRRVEGTEAKVPTYVRLADGSPFAFAGLWESWKQPDGGRLHTCTIITTEPNELMRTIHDRMPVILPESGMKQWMQPDVTDPAALLRLLRPFPADRMEAYPVSRRVNHPSNDGPDLVVPELQPVSEADGVPPSRKRKPPRKEHTQGPGLFKDEN